MYMIFHYYENNNYHRIVSFNSEAEAVQKFNELVKQADEIVNNDQEEEALNYFLDVVNKNRKYDSSDVNPDTDCIEFIELVKMDNGKEYVTYM